jgi:hypothetical protein
MRQTLPIIITVTAALIVVITFFLPVFVTDEWAQEVLMQVQGQGMVWMMVIGSIAAGLGAVSLTAVHLPRVMRMKPEWWRSALLLLALLATTVIGLGWGIQNPLYMYLFNNLYTPLASSLMALLAFFLAAAAFRAFRVRNLQAALLVLSAAVVILGTLPAGQALWGGFGRLSRWLLEVPGMAGLRGIGLGASLGAIAIMLRVILGLERGYHVG